MMFNQYWDRAVDFLETQPLDLFNLLSMGLCDMRHPSIQYSSFICLVF